MSGSGDVRSKKKSGGGVIQKRKKLRHWLIGLAIKTAENLEIERKDFPKAFEDLLELIEHEAPEEEARDVALLLWCGSATLTIRGSAKAMTGKRLEGRLVRATLTVLGLSEEDGDFRTGIRADEEVSRETDAEVRTPRGYMHVEVGLISKGNPEVITDKVGRLNKNDVILMDLISAKSTAYKVAEERNVKLIQLRNNNPVEELRTHMHALKVLNVHDEPLTLEEVEQRVLDLPLTVFQ